MQCFRRGVLNIINLVMHWLWNMFDPSGDRSDDFAQLLAEHQAQLFGYVYALIPNMTDAEDVYQDTVIALWQKFNDYQPGTNFAGWARVVARFKIQHFFRTKSRRRVYFDEGLLAEISETQARIESARHGSPLDSYTPALLRCIERLPESDRQLIRLSYEEEKNLTQIAKDFGRSPQSIWNSLSRIRRVLFDCIRQAHQAEVR